MDGNDKDILISDLTKRKCLIFIGAGMSIAAGLPSGQDLTDKLFEVLSKKGNYSKPNNYTLPRLASDFEAKIGRTGLEEIIRNQIIDKMANCNLTAYELLAKLEPLPEYIITTNYDRLLEKTLGERNYVPIFSDEAISKHNDSKTNLLKIHGDIDSLEDAIITENDLQDFEKNKPTLHNKIINLLSERSVLFLGFSVEDAHIRKLYLNVRRNLGKHAPKAYAITLDDSEGRFDELGIKHIKQDVTSFLKELLNDIEKEGHCTIPFQIPQTPNSNPFSIYNTENFENTGQNLLNETFIQPVDFLLVVEPGNTIIEGHRGSGKSMILKYLSFEEQLKRNFNMNWDKKYIGVYFKFRGPVVDTVTYDLFKGNEKQWQLYFMSYVSLILGEQIVLILMLAIKAKKASITSEELFVQKVKYRFSFPSSNTPSEPNSLQALADIINKERNSFAQNHSLTWSVPGDFLEEFVSIIKEYVEEWSDKNIYFLLDEYDNLNTDQQKVVNTLIKTRSFSYKIGVKLFDMVYEDSQGRLLEEKNDYIYVSTDRFDSDYRKYIKFASEVANKRLTTYKYTNNIHDLLLEEDNVTKKGFENGDYSGFENIAKLSSGNVRIFLELCKDMIYYANSWVFEESISENKNTLEPISPNIQNTVIKIHSNILYEGIDKISGMDTKTKRSRSENVRLLIDSLAEIFSRILHGSKSAEKRTVSGFQLKDKERLTETAINALNDSVSRKLLQVPYYPRKPQEAAKYAPHKRYRFHKLLCPRFKLSLTERWPKEISSDVFNSIFTNPKETVNSITQYFIDDITPKIDTKLTDFEIKNDN